MRIFIHCQKNQHREEMRLTDPERCLHGTFNIRLSVRLDNTVSRQPAPEAPPHGPAAAKSLHRCFDIHDSQLPREIVPGPDRYHAQGHPRGKVALEQHAGDVARRPIATNRDDAAELPQSFPDNAAGLVK
jgi:hypothetical protein